MNNMIDNPDYPELLAEVARKAEKTMRDHGVAADKARQAAFELSEELRDEWGGQLTYIRKGGKLYVRKRWREVWAMFDGHNHGEIARKLDLSLSQVYKILEVMKRVDARERMGDLFE